MTMNTEPQTGYEPNRIPASVFSSTTTTPTREWSAASTESLFSIQMGNASFSRDHLVPVFKSEDSSGSDQPNITCTNGNNNSNNNNSNSNSSNNSSNNDVVSDSNQNKAGGGVDHKEKQKSQEINQLKTEGLTKPKPDCTEDTRNSASVSFRSDASYNSSTHSFAFPVFQGEPEGRNTPINHNIENGKFKNSRNGRKEGKKFESQNSKSRGNGWLSCCFCLSQKD